MAPDLTGCKKNEEKKLTIEKKKKKSENKLNVNSLPVCSSAFS